jgi:hypothetical protein
MALAPGLGKVPSAVARMARPSSGDMLPVTSLSGPKGVVAEGF